MQLRKIQLFLQQVLSPSRAHAFLAALVLSLLVTSGSAHAIPIVPDGYSITPFVTGLDGPASVEFAPAGAYGGDLYVSEFFTGEILRIDPITKAVSVFAASGQFANNPHRIRFGPSGDFGGLMYVVDFEIATPTDYVRSVSPSGVVSSPLISSSGMGAAGIEFGPGGAYGTNLFVADSPGGVLEVTSSGSSTSFAALNALTLAFDPSGKYGGKLYAAKDYRDGGDGIGGLRVIDSDGSVSDFGAQTLRIPVVMRFDPYGAFNNDLFLFDTDVNETYRISPTGDRQVFMSGFSLSGLAFTPDGSMYFSHSDDGTIYKVNAVVPEPGTLALVSIGALALLPRARKRARQDLHTVTLNPPHPHIFPA